MVSSGTQSLDPLVTVVVTHRGSPNHVDDFLAWQHHLVQEENKFEGFRGTELFRPIEGFRRNGPRCTATTARNTSTRG